MSTPKPLKLLSTILLTTTVLILFIFLFTRTTTFDETVLGPVDKTSVYKNINWTNAIPAAKTAYVYTYFTGRHDDTQRFIATLVSIKALKQTNTQRDIIVMVDHNISTQNMNEIRSIGAIVHPIQKHELFHNKDRNTLPLGQYCYSNFAPIYAWSLYQYERVIWLDADVLPQMNMDELFLCGEFCMTYANLQWYIASLFVLKPSKIKFEQLFNNLATRGVVAQKLLQQRVQWFQTIPECQDLFEEFIFQSFYHLESADLFNSESTGQSHVPMMRLNMGYNMNPIFWYEHYDWNLSRGGAYAKMLSNDPEKIPAHSIGFPRVKPYDWIQGIYWNTNWVWAHWRRLLLQESFFWVSFITIFLSTIWYIFSTIGLDWIVKSIFGNYAQKRFQSSSDTRISTEQERLHRITFGYKFVSLILRIANTIGVSIVGAIIGCVLVFVTGFGAYKFIPSDTPYYIAYPLFAITLSLLQQATLSFTSLFLYYGINGMSVWIENAEIINLLHKNKVNKHTPQYTQQEWELINTMADGISNDTNKTILFFLNETTGCLSPLTQLLLIQKLTHWRNMLINMLLVGGLYIIHQYQIFPVFAVKIITMFLGALYCFVSFINPYLTLFLIAYYAEGGRRSWRRLKLN